jgi:phosphatidylglycerophosphate synthase
LGLIAEYTRTLKLPAVEEFFDLFFYRPLAFFFVKLIAHTEITPNQLTVASMVFGALGGFSYTYGTPEAYAWGGILYLLYNIIDCSDGQLARLKNSGSAIGRILDGVADYVVSVAVYLGIGIGYAGTSSSPAAMWALTVAAGISNAVQSGLLDFYRNRFLDIVLQRKSVLDEGVKGFQQEYEILKREKRKMFDRLLIWIYLRYSSIQARGTSGKKEEKPTTAVDPQIFRQKNRVIIHFWTYLGPTTQWTLLIVTSLINRLDIYLWGIAVVGNIIALILFLVQKRIDLKLGMQEPK